jgi:hypothetical protein
MSFYDTKLSNSIEYAFQALALDERRSAFSPAVWEKPPGNHTVFPLALSSITDTPCHYIFFSPSSFSSLQKYG